MNRVIESFKITFKDSGFVLRFIAWIVTWFALWWVPPYAVGMYVVSQYGFGWMLLAVTIVVISQVLLVMWYRTYCYLADKDGFMNTSRWKI